MTRGDVSERGELEAVEQVGELEDPPPLAFYTKHPDGLPHYIY